MTKNTIKIDTTKRGFAAMWEKGGGMTSGGSAQVITGKEGEARRPIYTPRGGHLACGKHALIGVANGFYVVKASVARGTRSSANISRIVSTSVKDIDGERWEEEDNCVLPTHRKQHQQRRQNRACPFQRHGSL